MTNHLPRKHLSLHSGEIPEICIEGTDFYYDRCCRLIGNGGFINIYIKFNPSEYIIKQFYKKIV